MQSLKKRFTTSKLCITFRERTIIRTERFERQKSLSFISLLFQIDYF